MDTKVQEYLSRASKLIKQLGGSEKRGFVVVNDINKSIIPDWQTKIEHLILPQIATNFKEISGKIPYVNTLGVNLFELLELAFTLPNTFVIYHVMEGVTQLAVQFEFVEQRGTKFHFTRHVFVDIDIPCEYQ